MNELVLFPACNWFCPQCMCVTSDGWLIYGMGRGICVVNPLNSGVTNETRAYDGKCWRVAHSDRVVSVAILPTWSSSRLFVSSANDGMVKLWSADNITCKKAHNNHQLLKESVVAVSCADDDIVVSVGSSGTIIVWNVTQNVTKEIKVTKNAKPSCLQCCPHNHNVAAVGTKIGTIYIISLKDHGKLLCVMKAHDSEIKNINWSPTKYNKIQKIVKSRSAIAKTNMNEEHRDSATSLIKSNALSDMANREDTNDNNLNVENEKSLNPVDNTISETTDHESEAGADDTFDIYTDFDDNEFGHTKYKPEKIKLEKAYNEKKTDFLGECAALKEDILSLKTNVDDSSELLESTKESEMQILLKDDGNLLNDDNKDLTSHKITDLQDQMSQISIENEAIPKTLSENIVLAAIDLQGKVSIWDISGQLIAMGTCMSHDQKKSKVGWANLHWSTPECVVATDHSGQVFTCNPNKLDRGKLKWKFLHHIHKKMVFSFSSNLEQNGQEVLWSASYDRKIVCYSMRDKKPLNEMSCISGCITTLQSSDLDPMKIAVGTTDGSIFIWNMEMPTKENTGWGPSACYWHGIQNKVLQLCWHPKKENLLAFSTVEGRVALLNTSLKENAPIPLKPAFVKGVYCLTWGEDDMLYASSGNGVLKVYQTSHTKREPETLKPILENEILKFTSSAIWDRHLIVGTMSGSVVIFSLDNLQKALAVAYPSSKDIYYLKRHPKAVTSEDDPSPYADWFAVAASEKSFSIMKIIREDTIQLEIVNVMEGHSAKITDLVWSPHHNARILSTSDDTTVQVWDAIKGTILSTFSGHCDVLFTALWCPLPEHDDIILSAGADMSLRAWNVNDHPPSTSCGVTNSHKKKMKLAKITQAEVSTNINISANTKNGVALKDDTKLLHENNLVVKENDSDLATKLKTKKTTKLYNIRGNFLFNTHRQQGSGSLDGCKLLFRKYLETHPNIDVNTDDLKVDDKYFVKDCLKIYGNRDDIIELLDFEEANVLENRKNDYLVGWFISIFKGEIDKVIRIAIDEQRLDPFILCLAPSVSHRFWKEALTAYGLQQEDSKILDSDSYYGGIFMRRVISKLALQDITGAIDCLLEVKLFKEAIVLARVRYLDELADEIILKYADYQNNCGAFLSAAEIYLAVGQPDKAIDNLRRLDSRHLEYKKILHLTYQLAKCVENDILANTVLDQLKTLE